MTGLEGFRAMSEGELDIRAWWLFLGMVLEASIYINQKESNHSHFFPYTLL